MSRSVAAILSAASLWFAGCHHATTRQSDAQLAIGPFLHRHLLVKAGEHAVNCGWSGNVAEFPSMSQCALDAAKHARPFVVQYREMGIDSAAQIGFVLTSDRKLLEYPMPDGKFFANNTWFQLHDCEPASLYRNERKTLDCKVAGEPRYERE